MLRTAPIVFFALASLATGQSLVGSVSSPISCSAQLGTQTQTATQPSGALPPDGTMTALVGQFPQFAWATGSWNLSTDATRLVFSSQYSASCAGGPGSQAAFAEDVLLTVTAPVPTEVWLQLVVPQIQVTGGQVAPTLRIDVDDDGVFELTEGNPTTVTLGRTVGPSGLVVRCRCEGAVVGAGLVGVHAAVQVLPRGVGSAVAAIGCDGTSVTCLPRFDGDLMLGTAPQWPGLFSVLVLGLGVQPAVVGSYGGSLPCVLWPSVDALLFVPPFDLSTLAIPPGAHPFQFWVQTASFHGSAGFSTSDALLVFGT